MTRKRLLIAVPLALVALLAVLALVGGLAGTRQAERVGGGDGAGLDRRSRGRRPA